MEFFDISSENIEIIYYGVDSDHFIPWIGFEEKRQEIRKQLGLKEHEFVLLQMDAFTPRRGLLQGLQVLSVLKKNELDQVKLLAVGEGEQRLFKRWIEKLGLQERVIFESPKRPLRDYYWAADTLFFPSYYEPFGLYALEALSCQLPVVISQWAGCAELMKDHESALFIDPFSRPEKISNILLEVIKDPNKAQKLGENGRKVAEKRSWDQVGYDYIRFYQDLNEKKPK
jgi:glycosyltransferase involved in cell wall biosynthesis